MQPPLSGGGFQQPPSLIKPWLVFYPASSILLQVVVLPLQVASKSSYPVGVPPLSVVVVCAPFKALLLTQSLRG